MLKVPKCEIFNRSYFHDFYTMKGSIWGCEIPYEYAQSNLRGCEIPYEYAQSNFKERSPFKTYRY